MTRLESILQGIERLPISANKKNMYMLEILYEADSDTYKSRKFHYPQSITPAASLNASFVWSGSFRGYGFYCDLYKKMLLRNA
jgi:hypothetical protein